MITTLDAISDSIPEVDANGAPIIPRKWIDPLTPSQCRDWKMPSGYKLVGDFHVTRGGITIIGGPPGLGKSRAALHLAAAGATGENWFDQPVHEKFKTFILQNENGRHRLQSDFADIHPELDDFIRITPPPEYGMRFDCDEFKEALKDYLNQFKPGVVVLDPFTNIARDCKQGDYSDAFDAIRECLPKGENMPAVVVVAHTRKPKVGERANGTALLNELLGSVKLVSIARAAYVMQAATTDTTDPRVVWTCCKNNDGEKGPRTAWRRENGIFTPCPDFDWEEFDNGPERQKQGLNRLHLREVFEGGAIKLPRAEAAKRLMASASCSKTTAYDALQATGRFADELKETAGQLEWVGMEFPEETSGGIPTEKTSDLFPSVRTT